MEKVACNYNNYYDFYVTTLEHIIQTVSLLLPVYNALKYLTTVLTGKY